jgi:threonine dehydrogenase-like Zn-dependent dehydrogenase
MNKKTLIVGSGIIGNLWASILHYKGMRNVVISEASETRRQITEKLGMNKQILNLLNIYYDNSIFKSY